MKHTYPTLSLVLFSLCGMPMSGHAQLLVTDSLPLADIGQLLEGMNLTISNVQVNCAGRAMGGFAGNSGLNINQGLVLTTGSAMALAGPAGNWASESLGLPGDADLDIDAGTATYDACVLEFDCIPAGDTLLFNFSFGSEEYPEFVGSAFNDIFAIYLSGDGIPFPVNVAQLPDGTPVAINNVNAADNSAYFHDNETPPGPYVAYDGYTTNLTAFAEVVPGGNYHFKVAIADAADGVWDSGVFLQAFSFRSVVNTTQVGEPGVPSMGLSRQGNTIYITWPSGQAGQDLAVYDAMGRNVMQLPVAGHSASFDASSLPTGAYTVLLRGGGLAPVRFVQE